MTDGWIVDSAPSKRHPIYTRANVGEVFPDPVTPYTATAGINRCAEPGWRDALERFGAFTLDEFDPDINEIVGVYGGYCYLNVSLSRILGVRTPGLTPEIIDQTFFGEQPGITPYTPRDEDESPERTAAIGQTLQWILTTEDLPELVDDQQALNRLRDDRPDLAKLSEQELADHLRWLSDSHMRRLFATHLFITYASTVPTGIIQQVCTEIGHPEFMLPLMAGVGGVDSAAPSWAMWDLGRVAADSPSVTAEFERGAEGLLDRLRAAADAGGGDADKFLQLFAEFVHEFGCRGPNEWESRSPTWETAPELALVCIDRMRLMDPKDSPASHLQARADEREQLGAQLVEQLAGNPEVQGQFAAGLRAATVFLAGRERSKTNAIKLVHEMRLTLHELGRRYVERGVLDSSGNLSMLRYEEVDDFLRDPESWADEIRKREVRYSELSSVEPPFVFEGKIPSPKGWPKRDSRPVAVAGVGDVLVGLPGCPGQATGRARIITDSYDPTALEPGDILVAPLTDPSWTPLFVPAAAVIVDVGAALSHAIIVSRELGIPCAVSVTDATRRIVDGSIVTVDGSTGVVTIDEVPG